MLTRLARGAGAPEAYLVGGALRDLLLGRPVADLDVAVRGDPRAFAEAVARAFGTRVVYLPSEHGNLLRVPAGEGYMDLVAMRGDIASDLAARDFTVNALAVPLAGLDGWLAHGLPQGEVVDCASGLADLEAGVLRPVRADSLQADPVRALRGIRLATELGFALAPETERAIEGVAPRVSSVPGERLAEQLLRLFALPAASRGVRLMDATGLLGACFPELEAGRGLEQRPVHRYTVLEHQLVALEWMDVLFGRQPPEEPLARRVWHDTWDGEWPASRWGDVREHLEANAATLRLATLLHDAGKPATRTVEADGRTRFFGHSEAGAALAREALTRLRMPGRVVERVALLLGQHLRPGQVASPGEPPTARALHRFQADLGDATPDVCFLFLADSLATAGADVLGPRWPAYVAHVRQIIAWSPPPAAAELRRLVDGHAVMRATGLGPGPEVGRILAAVNEAAAAGEATSEAEVLALVRTLTRAESVTRMDS